jgi:hypothetical protein
MFPLVKELDAHNIVDGIFKGEVAMWAINQCMKFLMSPLPIAHCS